MDENGSNGDQPLPRARLLKPSGLLKSGVSAREVRPPQPALTHGFYSPTGPLSAEQLKMAEAILDLPHVTDADRLAAEEVARLLALIQLIDALGGWGLSAADPARPRVAESRRERVRRAARLRNRPPGRARERRRPQAFAVRLRRRPGSATELRGSGRGCRGRSRPPSGSSHFPEKDSPQCLRVCRLG
jgi:hypothetical protein